MNDANSDAATPGPRLAPEVLDERLEDDACEQRIRVPDALACWPGHFPDYPVVPGVLQVQWAMRLAERWLGARPSIARIEVLKFKRLLFPGRELTVRVSRGSSGAGFDFALADGDVVFSSGRVKTGAT